MTTTDTPAPPQLPRVESQWTAALPVRDGDSEHLWLESWNYRVALGDDFAVVGFRHAGGLLALFVHDLGDRALTLGLDAALLYVVERDLPVTVTDLRLAFEAVAQTHAADSAQLAAVIEHAERQRAEAAPMTARLMGPEDVVRGVVARCGACGELISVHGHDGLAVGYVTDMGLRCGPCCGPKPAPSQPPHDAPQAPDGPDGHADTDRPADATVGPAPEPPSPEPEPVVHLPALDTNGNPTGYALCDNGEREVTPGTLAYGGPLFGKADPNCPTCLEIDESGA